VAAAVSATDPTPEWRASSADTVEDDLAAVWREPPQRGLSRALMSNLVIAGGQVTSRHLSGMTEAIGGPLLAEVVERHPARAILLDYAPDGADADAADSVGVGVLGFGPPSARYGVEAIAVRVVCAEQSIPSIVARLIRGGLPTTLWWTGDLSRGAPPAILTALARQLLYDSASWRDVSGGLGAVAEVLGRSHAPEVADLNWRRLAPMRHALVQAAAGAAPDADPRDLVPAAVRVKHRPGSAALAWLLAGWLGSRLGWRPSDGTPQIDEASDGAVILAATIGNSGWRASASMTRCGVAVTIGGSRAPLLIPVPAESEGAAAAAELLHLASDQHLKDAVLALTAGRGPR